MRPAFRGSERFEILSELGRGGMGVVYEAFDRERGHVVALKHLRALTARELLRFKDEFRAVRDVQHPNVVALGELVEHDGEWFFTMELVEGADFLTHVRTSGADAPTRTDDGEATVAEPVAAAVALAATTRTDTRPPAGAAAAPLLAPGDGFDEARLRAGLAELAGGLAAVHRAGVIHRDIKPTNVMVARDGRVVLLDFGVAFDAAERGPRHRVHQEVVGTYAYMAPEQTLGEVGAAADWYAVGVILFQALTGHLPFDGGKDVMQRKRIMDAPALELFATDLPADLSALCMRLLARAPEERPVEAEILATLGATEVSRWVGATPLTGAGESVFVGREAELQALREALLDSRTERPVFVVVEGESGVGKTALVERFLGETVDRDPTTLVLRGRCHEKEIVPYNAFDGMIDDLAALLRDSDPARAAELAPARTAELLQLFPVLRGAGALLGPGTGDPDPSGARTAAFAALARLLANIARRRPLIAMIDDVQWADSDSVELLRELLARIDTSVLVVATARRRPDEAACAAANLPHARRLVLDELSHDDARALALQLRARLGSDAPGWDPEPVLRETGGHPLFIDALLRHGARTDADQHPLRLDDALAARVRELPPPARALVEIVAVAGAPIAQVTAARAAGLAPAEYAGQAGVLRGARLARITGARHGDTIESFHDRVREAVYAQLPPGRARLLHRALAETLERDGAGAEILAMHYGRAHVADKALRYTVLAARRAASGMAFERAAELYQGALAWADQPGERLDLLIALGDALSNTGRARQAARAFQDAAELAGLEQQLELRRRAAEQFLMGGALHEGLEATDAVLRVVGMRLPRSKARALAALGYTQLRLGLRRLQWTPRGEHDIEAAELTRLDICWSAAAGLSMVDTVRGALFATRAPLLCLETGEQFRIARSLSAATIAAAAMSRRKQSARLLAATERAAEAHGSELARFYLEIGRGARAFLLDNDWARCNRHAALARSLWRAAGRGRGWEVDVVQEFDCWSLAALGELAELRRRIPGEIRAARRCGNHFAEVMFRTSFAVVTLLEDRPDDALADVEDAIASWLPGSTDFGNPHYWALKSRTLIALYRPGELAGNLADDWRRLDRALLRRVGIIRAESALLRGCLAVRRACDARRAGRERDVQRLVDEAERWARQLSRVPLPMSSYGRMQLDAAIAHLRGDDDGAARLLRALTETLGDHGMRANVTAVRHQLGTLLGGDEGEALIGEARRAFEEQGARAPDRVAHMLMPGWVW